MHCWGHVTQQPLRFKNIVMCHLLLQVHPGEVAQALALLEAGEVEVRSQRGFLSIPCLGFAPSHELQGIQGCQGARCMIAQPLDSLYIGATCVTSRDKSADCLALTALASLPLRFDCSPACVQGAWAVLVAPLGSPRMAPDAKEPMRSPSLCSDLPPCSLYSLLCVQPAEALVATLVGSPLSEPCAKAT